MMINDDQAIRLDLEGARRNFGGDESLVRDIGEIFVEDVPVLLQQLAHARARLSQGAPQELIVLAEVQRLAHSLKGLAGTFGAEPLGTLLAEIEREPRVLVAQDSEQRLQVLDHVAKQTVDELRKCLD